MIGFQGDSLTHGGKRAVLAKLNLDAENLDGGRALGRGILAFRVDSVRRESDACPGFQEIRLRADAEKRAEHCLRGEGRLRPRTGMSLFSVVQHHAERRRANCERKELSSASGWRLESIGTGLV
jgi:hypothetical protein